MYDPAQYRDKGLGRRLYEKVAEGGVSKILKNPPRKEVATVASLSGPIENPGASTIEVIVKLLQNAFFKGSCPASSERSAASVAATPVPKAPSEPATQGGARPTDVSVLGSGAAE